MGAARLKHFGWGREGEGLTTEEEAFVIARAEARFGTALNESASAPRLEDIKLEAPRVTAPASLRFCTSEHYDRAGHTYGKSYPELARALARDYTSAPDVVAYPRNEADLMAVLDWAGGADATRAWSAASNRSATATGARSQSTCAKWTR
jgi:alkyldihydroxyacetonephosphate synthase